MERQKQVKTIALVKMETYLNQVYLKIGKGDFFSLDALAKENKLSGTIATVLKRTGILKPISNIRTPAWEWLHSTKPNRALALTMMDEVARYNLWNKKTMLQKALSQAELKSSLFNTDLTHSDLEAEIKNSLIRTILTPVAKKIVFTDDDFQFFRESLTFASQELINIIYKPNLKKDEEKTGG